MSQKSILIVAFTVLTSYGFLARAQEVPPDAQEAPTEPVAVAAAEPAPTGLLPMPDYSGDLRNRAHLFGDLGGVRSDLANRGIHLNIDWVQTVQSVVRGGIDTGAEYGGSLDYLINLDLDRMGVMPGALLKIRAESRYGESVNGTSGSLMPVSADGFFPLSSPLDSDIPITISDLAYYQFLSPKFGLVLGKLSGLDSDLNEFASGRGNSQFLNSQLIFSGAMALLPYSMLGAGAIIMPNSKLTITSVVMNLTDSSTTTGFSDIGDGAAWTTEASFQYRLHGLPGGSNVGFAYLWDTEFFNFGERFTFRRGEGLMAPTSSDTWISYLSGWQYLSVKDDAEGPLNLANGRPDREGIGIFWRGALADDEVNTVEWSLSGGLGGKGLIPGREDDIFGMGYYYNNIQNTRLNGSSESGDFGGFDGHMQGFEVFYNIALTPAAQLTLDAQWIDSAQSEVDTGVVLGMRLKLEF